MKKSIVWLLIIVSLFQLVPTDAYAGLTPSNATKEGINGKSVVAGVCSLLIWPGIGQYLNDCETNKNVTHAVIGLFPPFRLWSGWDALVRRKGGYWEGKI